MIYLSVHGNCICFSFKIPVQTQVECNYTKPCVQWKDASCLETAECVFTECSMNLSEFHLRIKGNIRNKYVHGDEITVTCDDQYVFENNGHTIDIRCIYGNWHSGSDNKIPRCLRYSDCETQPKENVRLSRENPDGASLIIKHDSFVRYFVFL